MTKAGHQEILSPDELLEASKTRWFNIFELEYLLNPETTPLTTAKEPPTAPPPSGTLLLFDRGITRSYKTDGYDWVKKRNSHKVREDHVKLRVEGKCRVAGVYVHCVTTPTLHRRAYYLLDPETGTSKSPLQYPPKKGGATATETTPEEITSTAEQDNVSSSLILLHYLDTKYAMPKAEKKSDALPKVPGKRGRKKGTTSDAAATARRRPIKSGVPRAKVKTNPNGQAKQDQRLIKIKKKRQSSDECTTTSSGGPHDYNDGNGSQFVKLSASLPLSKDTATSLHRLMRSCDDMSVTTNGIEESIDGLSEAMAKTECLGGVVEIKGNLEIDAGPDDALDTIWSMIMEDSTLSAAMEDPDFMGINANVSIKQEPREEGDRESQKSDQNSEQESDYSSSDRWFDITMTENVNGDNSSCASNDEIYTEMTNGRVKVCFT